MASSAAVSPLISSRTATSLAARAVQRAGCVDRRVALSHKIRTHAHSAIFALGRRARFIDVGHNELLRELQQHACLDAIESSRRHV